MTDRREVAVVRWQGPASSTEDGLTSLLTAYHLRTEEEKGRAVTAVGDLPERYRREIADPGTAFAADAVLIAVERDTAIGCVVVAPAVEGRSEVKRLWTDPAHRGQGIASTLLDAAFDHAARQGAEAVRLSVWEWRTGAIALYERLGFAVAPSWEERARLVCMERPV